MSEITPTQGQEPGALKPASEALQQPATPPVDPSAQPQAAQETEAGSSTEQEGTPRDPATGRFAKRTEQLQSQISTLTAQKHQAARELEQLSRQAEALRAQMSATGRVDPNDYEATAMANTQRAVIGVQQGLVHSQAQEAARRLAETRQATFMAKVDAARERIPDIDQALQAFVRLPVSDVAADLIAESDKSVEIANYLGRNPHEAHRIANLHPAYQGAEIARIEAKVAAQPMKRISQAPAPVTTVAGGSGNPTVDLSKLSMADYIKAREQMQRS